MSAPTAAPGRRVNAPGRRIALFGGTFDPIHVGHLAVARAAVRRFGLDQVHFIPSAHPPHKRCDEMAPFEHRFAMVALACAEHPRFVASLAESGAVVNGARGRAFYSIDTVRRFRRQLQGRQLQGRELQQPRDRLFFLLGADSFLQIASWKDYEVLLGLCDFVVAHRPGFRTAALRRMIPPGLLRETSAEPARGLSPARGPRGIPLRDTTVYLLDTVDSDVSATAVRRRLDSGRSVRGLVPGRVEEYISKQALYMALDQ